ncbi:MAG TPA: Gfo/Idh/MocA family oxidoreductase, partial [Chthonomonadaceae bacterium]|nr:Gfo/Idh/MocA family oxidoreductase [Chthonomonadaceae bacterium]
AGWFVSRRHLPDAKRNADVALTALCRRDEAARATMEAHFGLPAGSGFGDWRRMVEEAPLDAVLIATPNDLHYEQAKAALERGLHVLVEKPMTLRSEHAHELVALARAKGRKLAVALNPPHWAHCHRARRALQSESMGEFESGSIYWTGSAAHLFGRAPRPADMSGVVPPTDYRSDPERNGGGYFADGGPHLVSELLWLTGLRVKRVTALMDALPADIRIAVCFEMENGAMATITSIGDSRYEQRRVRNVFSSANGTVTINYAEFETHIQIKDNEPVSFREATLTPVSGPIANFVDAILGRAELFSPGEHGAEVVDVVQAVYESARTGRMIGLQ